MRYISEYVKENQIRKINNILRHLKRYGIDTEQLLCIETENQLRKLIDTTTAFKIFQEISYDIVQVGCIDVYRDMYDVNSTGLHFLITDGVYDAIFNIVILLKMKPEWKNMDLLYINPYYVNEEKVLSSNTYNGKERNINYINFFENHNLEVFEFKFKDLESAFGEDTYYALYDAELRMYCMNKSANPECVLVADCFKNNIPTLIELLDEEFFENIGCDKYSVIKRILSGSYKEE